VKENTGTPIMSSQAILLKLHHLESSQSQRVLFALEELAEVHSTEYKLEIYKRGDGAAVSTMKGHFPLGKSPILTIEENGGPSKQVFQLPEHPGVLTESRLILQFLSTTFAQGMWDPQDDTDKCQDVFYQEFANYTLGLKTDFALIFEIIPAQLPFGLKQLVGLMFKPIVNYWMQDLQPIFKLMEDSLSEERPWFSGKKMGLADINMTWGMSKAWQRNYLDKVKYPKLAKWYETITQRSAYMKALEKGGSYNLMTFK
jgi:glutathione S-transferase